MATEVVVNETSVTVITAGAQGPSGPTGPSGSDGTGWLIGSGAPSVGLGDDGNYYVNELNEEIYRKVSGAWVVKSDFDTVNGGYY